MRLDQSLFARPNPGEQVVTADDADFLIDIMQVGFDRCQRDKQLARDIRIAFPLDDFLDNFTFTIGDPISRKEFFGKIITNQRGGNGIMEKIINEEDPIQGVWDGGEKKVAFRGWSNYSSMQGPWKVGQCFAVTERGKYQQANREVSFVRAPYTS